MYKDYDHARYVYETEIRRFEKDALAKAAEQACAFSARYCNPKGYGHYGWAFRVIDNDYSVIVDAEREEYGTTNKLEIIAFPVIKVTDTGFRIRRGGTDEQPETRFISHSWTKQWACRTPEEAVRSFIARRTRQAAILRARADKAQYAASKAAELIGEGLWGNTPTTPSTGL